MVRLRPGAHLGKGHDPGRRVQPGPPDLVRVLALIPCPDAPGRPRDRARAVESRAVPPGRLALVMNTGPAAPPSRPWGSSGRPWAMCGLGRERALAKGMILAAGSSQVRRTSAVCWSSSLARDAPGRPRDRARALASRAVPPGRLALVMNRDQPRHRRGPGVRLVGRGHGAASAGSAPWQRARSWPPGPARSAGPRPRAGPHPLPGCPWPSAWPRPRRGVQGHPGRSALVMNTGPAAPPSRPWGSSGRPWAMCGLGRERTLAKGMILAAGSSQVRRTSSACWPSSLARMPLAVRVAAPAP